MDLSGQTLGKYELIRRLGKGGMAEVYLANQPTIERQVAIKVLHRHLAENEDFILRFKREARSLGQLQHPNIVNIYDFDSHNDVYYMVMDYIAGPTLRSYLDDKKILPNEESLKITAQLVEGLAYAHQKGAVHRDIKPANVMFTDDSLQQAVITDFGITRLMNDQTITLEGSMVGTPAYMSPEAVIGERVDGRADIYSMGVILYEMVTGRTPYEGATPLSLVVKQVHEPLPSPLEFMPDLATPMVELIEKALSKDLNGRFQTASEFLQAIQQTQDQLNLPIIGATMARTTMPAMPKIEQPPEPQEVDEPTKVAPPKPEPTGFDFKKAAPFIGGGLVILLIIAGILLSRGNNNGQVADDPTATAVAEVVDPTPADEDPVPVPEEATPVEAENDNPTPPPTEEPPPPTPIPPTPEPERIPPIEQGRTGIGQLLSSEVGVIDGVYVEIGRVPQPPPGFQYQLSFIDDAGEVQNVGPVTVEGQQILFEEAGNGTQFGLLCDLLITQEPESGIDVSNLGDIIFSGTMSPEIKASLQELLEADNGRLPNLFSQTATAQQHYQFSLDSLSSGNFDEAKRHMEHVINILDGESGETFGDLNLDGQTQNPGDGVGVRVYLEETLALIEAIKAVEPVTLERQTMSDQAITAVSETLNTVNTAIQRAAAITATDTPEEASPIYDEVTVLLGELDIENRAAYNRTLSLATIPVSTTLSDLPEPDPIVGIRPSQFGVFEVFNGPDTLASEFRLRVEQITPLEEGQIIQAWLQNRNGGNTLPLGTIELVQNRGQLSGSASGNILESFDEVLVTIETAGNNANSPSGAILLQGPNNTPTSDLLLGLHASQFGDGKGAIFGLEEQLALAIQHFGFAQAELDAGNLAGVKVHFEHVINILDGRSGEIFGDLNGDGQTQNPGDDIGVRVYFEQIQAALADSDPRSRNQEFTLNQLSAMLQNNLAELSTAIEQGNKVFASDTIEEAEPFIDTVGVQFDSLQNGRDLDGNDTIEPLQNEGGIQLLKDTLTRLIEVPLSLDE